MKIPRKMQKTVDAPVVIAIPRGKGNMGIPVKFPWQHYKKEPSRIRDLNNVCKCRLAICLIDMLPEDSRSDYRNKLDKAKYGGSGPLVRFNQELLLML